MSDSTANPTFTPVDTSPAPPPRPYRGPVFIGDATTPLGGTTLLKLLWPATDR